MNKCLGRTKLSTRKKHLKSTVRSLENEFYVSTSLKVKLRCNESSDEKTENEPGLR